MPTFDDRYRRTENVFGTGPDRIIEMYAALMSPALPVLDVGAGQGRNAFYLARWGFSVDAIEPAPAGAGAIAEAAEREGIPVSVHTCGFEDFDAEPSGYAGVLLIGMTQVLSREATTSLLKRVELWTAPRALVFVTAFMTGDARYARHEREWSKVGRHSFVSPDGDVRTYFEAGELRTLFSGYREVHYWEGLGPEHSHDDSAPERHALVEAVFAKPADAAGEGRGV